ncbi:MAG: GxxExxY protein [Chloroflexi bacterium]|nr:GxxExxY protein [Chloroflexota bacterium]
MATRTRIPHQELTYRIIGCAMHVHNQLGPGLREATYQKALSLNMAEAGLAFEAEKPVEVTLDGARLGMLYIDHLVEDSVVVEEKALSHLLTADEVAQVITYLAATGLPVGLLLNFGRRRLQYKRVLPPRTLDAWHDHVHRYIRTSPQ